jgi:hypothetical protein
MYTRGFGLNSRLEFKGRLPLLLTLSGALTLLGFLLVALSILRGSLSLSMVGVLELSVFLPIFSYAVLTKKVVVTDEGIEYYVSSMKKFDSRWNEVSKIVFGSLAFSLTPRGEKRVFLRVFAGRESLDVSSLVQLPNQTIREIYVAIMDSVKPYPDIRVELTSMEGTEVIQDGKGKQHAV